MAAKKKKAKNKTVRRLGASYALPAGQRRWLAHEAERAGRMGGIIYPGSVARKAASPKLKPRKLKKAPPKMVSGQKVDEKAASRVESLKAVARFAGSTSSNKRVAAKKRTAQKAFLKDVSARREQIKKPAASMSKTSASSVSRSVKKTQLSRMKKTSAQLSTPASPKYSRKKTPRRKA